MIGCTGWSYAPYRPFLFNVGDIYINRLAPGTSSIHCEWLDENYASEYEVMLRVENTGDFQRAATVNGNEVTIDGLMPDTDYELYVCGGGHSSRVRLFRTGECVGTVVNYLHPRDDAYSFSGHYLCSPCMIRLDDGTLIASMDLFAAGYPQNLTLLFRSKDGGQTWHYLSELYPCFWARLFLHKGEIYALSCNTEYGDLIIGKSSDDGKTFCTPTVLLRGAGGRNGEAGIHKNPQPPIIYNGRIYGTLEWGSWGRGYHAAMVMSADTDSDLLDPHSWHFTPPVKYDPTWPGVANGISSGNIEGTLAIAPDGKLYNVMRYDMTKCTPNYGLVLAYRVNTDDPDAPLTYDHAIRLPGNHAKFMIRYDDVTGKYLCIICRILNSESVNNRNLLSLMVSDDMENWRLAMDLIDRRNDDPAFVGFQYVDFMIDGDDLIYLSRTAINGAKSYHDNNYQTFHRLKGFREIIK